MFYLDNFFIAKYVVIAHTCQMVSHFTFMFLFQVRL